MALSQAASRRQEPARAVSVPSAHPNGNRHTPAPAQAHASSPAENRTDCPRALQEASLSLSLSDPTFRIDPPCFHPRDCLSTAQSNGSARVTIANNGTDVLAAVKVNRADR